MHFDARLRCSLIAACFLHCSTAFYVPGISIKSYAEGEPVPLYVNKIYSDKSSFTYAYNELPFVCKASRRPLDPASNLITGSSVGLNLGEILRGDRITLSDYDVHMQKEVKALKLCDAEVDREGIDFAKDLLQAEYRAEWIVDNMPGATPLVITTGDQKTTARKYYARGFSLGEVSLEGTGKGKREMQYYIYNHFKITLRYRIAPGKAGQKQEKVIVGFEVHPQSIGLSGRNKDGLPKDLEKSKLPFKLPVSTTSSSSEDEAKVQIPYTYSVNFLEDDTIEWANRWELYMIPQSATQGIHWLAITNSLVIAGLLAAIVAVILARTIQGDIKARGDGGLEEGKARGRKTNGLLDPLSHSTGTEIEGDADMEDEATGWKLVHGDVFRAPEYGHALAPLFGSGVQLAFMTTGLLILSCIGVLNPSYRGGFASVSAGLFLLGGTASGYYSARAYKTWHGELWKTNAFITAALIPSLLFGVTFLLNLFAWAQASSTALPFTTILALCALWVLIQLPLVYTGAYIGFVKYGSYPQPIKPSPIPRQIPSKPWWAGTRWSILLSGAIPFAAVFIELIFVFKSVWQDKSSYYYLFGFTSCVFVILLVTVIELTICSTYFLLCHEDHRWQWHSFFVGASSALWIFAYCIYYYFTRLQIQGFTSSLLFFSYSALSTALYGTGMGVLGFFTAWTFVTRIYSAIKVD